MGLKSNRSELKSLPRRFETVKMILFMPSAPTLVAEKQVITKVLHLEMTAVDECKKLIFPKYTFNKVGYFV